MPFMNKRQEEDDDLPGVPGLHLDLERRVCPECGREGRPWEQACATCDVPLVAPSELRADDFHLPGLTDLDDEAEEATS